MQLQARGIVLEPPVGQIGAAGDLRIAQGAGEIGLGCEHAAQGPFAAQEQVP